MTWLSRPDQCSPLLTKVSLIPCLFVPPSVQLSQGSLEHTEEPCFSQFQAHSWSSRVEGVEQRASTDITRVGGLKVNKIWFLVNEKPTYEVSSVVAWEAGQPISFSRSISKYFFASTVFGKGPERLLENSKQSGDGLSKVIWYLEMDLTLWPPLKLRTNRATSKPADGHQSLSLKNSLILSASQSSNLTMEHFNIGAQMFLPKNHFWSEPSSFE